MRVNLPRRVWLPLAALGILALAAVLFVPVPSARGQQTTPAPTATPTAAAATAPGGCAPYDSWCTYCTNNPGAAACKDFVPPHQAGMTATGAMNNADDNLVPGVDQGLPPLAEPPPGAVPMPLPYVVP